MRGLLPTGPIGSCQSTAAGQPQQTQNYLAPLHDLCPQHSSGIVENQKADVGLFHLRTAWTRLEDGYARQLL
jgi:hypothetical protein